MITTMCSGYITSVAESWVGAGRGKEGQGGGLGAGKVQATADFLTLENLPPEEVISKASSSTLR